MRAQLWRLLVVVTFLCGVVESVSTAQVTLSGTNYFQNFNSIGTGLPNGWSLRTNATAASLGNSATFLTSPATWSESTFGFKNLASTLSNNGTNFNGSESLATQNGVTNRSLAIRQISGGGGGDPGAAFAVQLQDSFGWGNFQLTVDLNMLSVQTRSTVWTVDYGLGANPSSFVSVGTYLDPGAFGPTPRTFSFGTALDNQSQPIWIRIVALATSTGSGSRDSFGIDNFSLSYTSFTGTPPTITNQPTNQIAIEGGTATFSAGVSGTLPFSYQWQFNSTNLSLATNASLTLTNIAFSQAGPYRVIVSNDYGMSTSSVAQLTVNTAPPTITAHPTNQAVALGSNATFNITATGTPPLFYQWLKDGGTITNATNTVLTITNVTGAEVGSYWCTVSNAGGSTNSLAATLRLAINTVRLMHYNVKGNFSTNFTTNGPQVQAIGRQLQYLQPDIVTFNEIPAGSTFEVANIINHYLPGYYYATNSGTDTFLRSAIASRWNFNRTQKWLDGASLVAFGYNGTFTRDLFEAEIPVPGFGEPLHVFTTHLKSGSDSDESSRRAAEASAISNYFVTGFLTTNSARPYVLTGDLNEDINRPPSTSLQPIQRLVNSATGLELTTPLNPISNDDRTHSIQSEPLQLQRRYDYILPSSMLFPHILSSEVFRTDLLNPTPPELNASDSATASDHLPVIMVFNNPFLQQPLYFTQQPTSRTNHAGTTATFSIGAAGITPFTFQWMKNGTNLTDNGHYAGTGSSNLVISSVSPADQGSYSVLVSNASTNRVSQSATLTVISAPSILSDPQGATNLAGSNITFSVSVAGTPPFFYQWRFNGSDIIGATNQTFTITGMQGSDSGTYSVIVSNVVGAVESGGASLSVAIPFAQWNFNSTQPDFSTSTGSLVPSTGTGTAALIGGTSSAFAAGATSDPANSSNDNSGWNTSSYPPQSTGNKTGGVQFNLNTLGRSNITVRWEQRVSGSASKYFRFRYSTNGSDFVDFPTPITMNNDSVFETKIVPLHGFAGVENNSNLTIRVVSEWESTAIGSGNAAYVTTSTGYGGGGTVRFDMWTAFSTSGTNSTSEGVLRQPRADGGFFSFQLEDPGTWIIEVSTNLSQWNPIATNPAPFTFTDPQPMTLSNRFYRVLPQP